MILNVIYKVLKHATVALGSLPSRNAGQPVAFASATHRGTRPRADSGSSSRASTMHVRAPLTAHVLHGADSSHAERTSISAAERQLKSTTPASGA